jgi:GNAT superfamily N-acetyltransferase
MAGGLEVLLAAADRNMEAAWTGVLSAGPNPGRVHEDGVTMLSSGMPVPLFNPAFVVEAVDAEAVVAQVISHYGELDSPFTLYCRDEVNPGLADAGLAAGLVEFWQPPLMVLDPIPGPPPVPDGLNVVVVDGGNVGDSCVVLGAGFGVPVQIAEMLFGHTLLGQDNFTSFLAYADGQPVAASAVFVTDDIAGVYNVATVPDHRGKGYGAALTWAAADHGRGQGCTASILQASGDGEPVYARMGYATPTRYRQLQGPPTS